MHQSFLDVRAERWELPCHPHAHLHPSPKLPGSLRGRIPLGPAGLGGMGLAEGLVAVGVKQRAMANLGQPDDLVGAPRHGIPGQTSEWLTRGLGEEGCRLLGK